MSGASALYVGHLRHRRFAPRRNDFRYRIYLTLIDLDELPMVFEKRWLWSSSRPALAWFRRADYLGDPSIPLAEAVRNRVEEETGKRPSGPIRLLTHLRQFGYNFNPVSFYYVFDASGRELETVVAEITNTPWDERHSYVLSVAEAERVGAKTLRWQFDKGFHVSPFLPMDMRYDWRFTEPAETLEVHMENWREGRCDFDSTMTLRRLPMTSGNLARALWSFPLITLKVSALIYWQALQLWWKRTPFFVHPEKRSP
ncbi:MAG: hypothetical protein RL321_1130 [Pseudomonadota bacterium]